MKLTRNQRTDIAPLNVDETIFATQNNYLGVRGNFEETVPYQSSIRGTYINGFYDSHPIPYGEKAYGFPEWSQTLVNVPDAQTILVYVGQTPLNLTQCKLIDLKRTYHLQEGYTVREVTYETPEQHRFKLTFKRLTHLTYKPLFLIDVTVESLTYEGPLTIVSTLQGDVENYVSKTDARAGGLNAKYLDVKSTSVEGQKASMLVSTKETAFDMLVGLTHSVEFEYIALDSFIEAKKIIQVKPNVPYQFSKYTLYFNSLDHDDFDLMLSSGFNFIQHHTTESMLTLQKEALKSFDSFATIDIEDPAIPNIKEVIYYNLYQLYTAGGHSPRTNIPAKGLTGEGYEGHTFWDTEIYFIPFFMQVDPQLALNLLEYRYFQLEEARLEARTLAVPEGVKFAWRTINGKETSAYYAASTAQYHINSDIAYAVIKYYKLFKDDRFMKHKGFEILLETARFFKHVVHFHEGAYHMHHVTGPDEYTAVVDNNFYTNSMLKYHLEFLLDYVKSKDVDLINDVELEQFEHIAANLYLPYDETYGIDAQDSSFLSKKRWEIASIPSEKRPLLLHYHPLTIYRHQIIKQADTVLAHALLGNRPKDVMQRSFDYYEDLTTHDSSLSYCIHAMQAAKLGNSEKAYNYFAKTLALDLDNLHKNTQHGLHVANLGGMYLALVYGFLSFTIDDVVRIAPSLPTQWTYFKVNLRTSFTTVISVEITENVLYLKSNEDTKIKVFEEEISLISEKVTKIKL